MIDFLIEKDQIRSCRFFRIKSVTSIRRQELRSVLEKTDPNTQNVPEIWVCMRG